MYSELLMEGAPLYLCVLFTGDINRRQNVVDFRKLCHNFGRHKFMLHQSVRNSFRGAIITVVIWRAFQISVITPAPLIRLPYFFCWKYIHLGYIFTVNQQNTKQVPYVFTSSETPMKLKYMQNVKEMPKRAKTSILLKATFSWKRSVYQQRDCCAPHHVRTCILSLYRYWTF